MAQYMSHTRSETTNSYMSSRNVKHRKNKKVNPLPSIVSTTVNKSKVASSESLPLKQDQIVKTKFTVTNDLKHKIRKNKEQHEPVIDTPEFKLLCKLFVPPKYLIHNDKIAVKQLYNNLPLIVPGAIESNNSQFNLNFELHLFLSSIVTHYITSWYLSKLNTDNLEFVRNVYNILSEFAKDFIRRFDIILSNGLLPLINELGSILNNHIEEIVTDSTSTNDIKFVDDYLRENMNRNTIKNADKDVKEIIKQYLADKHVIFENIEIQIPSEKVSETQHAEGNRIQYFRLIAKELITISFDSNNSYDDISQSTPTTSHITMSLLTILIADLIIDKLFKKIASPQFMLETIINNTFDTITKFSYKNEDAQSGNKNNGPRTIGSLIYNSFNNITHLIFNIHNISETYGSYNSTNILENSLFRLINTVTDLSSKKPLLASFLQFIKRTIMANKSTARIFDASSKWFIYNQVARSGILSDEFSCKILRSLREGVFKDDSDEDAKENIQEEKMTIESLSCKMVGILSNQIPNSIFAGKIITNIFRSSNETDEDLKRSISKFLKIFNFDISSMDNNSINEVCYLNQLLMIQWIDCIVSNLYPELTKK
ncbi:DEHA2G15884p [Debaryomyces hansenii CBS767]|uniref:DEHA2G15884p n=1 Tax=Debaryomyces hansenii (strain ATCC 36239 / CBS 767 / BCRC 21394 / JCM 1990 / NBRC 0083 / IGC 2968) TaxID=284592 RepID=Q6BHT8_DEBHA|nr:DEHA2G15884p [Debaryomyces hansenii CBS767]CAG90729.2 DEHA2G15884p [Debaryomyces hansenii CBS767]|eukprot:XP_462233.2 DEHA2G15884p [Debaryomyces hansenii CBS767]